MENLKNEMTIRLVADNFGILMRNGSDCICPIVQPIQFRQIKQANIISGGQPQEEVGMQKTACNTGCPLFQINENDTVGVCCGSVNVLHKITKVITIEEQMSPKDNVMKLKIDKDIN